MNTVEEIKAHADVMEVKGFDFLDEHMNYARRLRKCVLVRVTFIDDKVMTCTFDEFSQFDTYEFKLRPTRGDA